MDGVEKIDLAKVDWKSSREFFESLGEALDKLDNKDESYDFTWVGKRKSIIEAGAPISKTLRPDIDESKNFNDTKNMLIVGDNLDALKLLQESYLGQIKMIYIDPPYNTGHDFVYHDNFTVKKEDFNDSSTDSQGHVIISQDEYAENAKTSGRFHSDWLSMMYPRLRLARNLLSDDGVIFISIGDDEFANLKKLCDEIYGDECFLGSLVRKTQTGTNNKAIYFSPSKDIILVYGKSNDTPPFNLRVPLNVDDYDFIETEDKEFAGRKYRRGESIYKTGLIGERPNSVFGITCPDGEIVYPPKNMHYKWSKKRFDSEYNPEKGIVRVMFKKVEKSNLVKSDGSMASWNVYEKNYLDENNLYKLSVQNDLLTDTVYTNNAATKELQLLEIPFDYAKPTKLLEFLANVSHVGDGDYILDFFSGSGTTGHATMNLNTSDGGDRRFILVQLDEKTDEKSEAKKTGYDTIDQITSERLRRVGEKIKQEKPNGDIDTGFRVFRIDDGNEKPESYKALGDINQEELFSTVDNIKENRTPLDLLFGVVYASALPFDLRLETRMIGDNTVYLYGYLGENSGLAACFDKNVSEETIKEIAKLKSLTVAFKDDSFIDSAAKINLSEQFRVLSPDTKVKVI